MRNALHTALAVTLLAAMAAPATAQRRGGPPPPPPPPSQQARQTQADAFTWSGELASGQRLVLRSLSGRVRVEPTTGRTLEISATKSWRRGNPELVAVEATRINDGRDVLVCARWSPNTQCDERGYQVRDGRGRGGSMRENDTDVSFVVRLPAGSNITVSTVNGGIEVTGATGDVDVRTLNGDLIATSTAGTVSAETINGNIRVRAARIPAAGVSYKTVNGTVHVVLPAGTNARLEARTVNGGIQVDFPVTPTGPFSPRRLNGTIGAGGPLIEISTINGQIRLETGG